MEIESDMLILTRSMNELLIIGDNMRVAILGNIKGNQVRVGIAASKKNLVHREEGYIQIKKIGN